MLQGLNASWQYDEIECIERHAYAEDGAEFVEFSVDDSTHSNSHGCASQSLHTQHKDISLVVLLHVALFWFLASSWQAPNKVEQLQLLQKPMLPKLKAFLYQMPSTPQQQVPEEKSHPVTVVEPEIKSTSEAIIEASIVTELEIKNKQQSAETLEQETPKDFNFKAATQSYLQRQQQQKFESLAFGNEQYRYGSLSEMTPQMKQEWLPARETFAEVENLDHQFDPNRIIREGHECFRIVKHYNPIAGDKENLGYKFKCGKTDQEKALAASLGKYLKKQ
ncbi:hypothetical protein SOPP22_00210 [Shewanella sp. OPT22]|nr:hypothetical protein SOPP22_00210 [Shewanella sp. OPT22]